jgi:hypothetical protein
MWSSILDPSAREANAEVQSGSYFGCFNRPDAIDRVVFHSVVAIFKIAELSLHLTAHLSRSAIDALLDSARHTGFSARIAHEQVVVARRLAGEVRAHLQS